MLLAVNGDTFQGADDVPRAIASSGIVEALMALQASQRDELLVVAQDSRAERRFSPTGSHFI